MPEKERILYQRWSPKMGREWGRGQGGVLDIGLVQFQFPSVVVDGFLSHQYENFLHSKI